MAYSFSDMQNWVQREFPNGKWENPGKTNWLISSPLREDKHPSFSIDIEKRVCLDRASGDSILLSALCERVGIKEPSREEGKSFPSRGEEEKKAERDRSIAYARKCWEEAISASPSFPYLAHKKVAPHDCRVGNDNGMGSVLLVPAFNADGTIVGVERIPSEPGVKKHLGDKKGTLSPIGDFSKGNPVLVAEGYATGESLHQITGWPVAVSFTWWNQKAVADIIKEKYSLEPCICIDAGEAGQKAAEECRAAGYRVVELPEGSPDGYDWNDLACDRGIEAGKALFREAWTVRKREEPNQVATMKLGSPKPGLLMIRADRLVSEPKEHLVKGLFTQNSLNVIFGVSGGSKTFYAIDLALSIASGQTFLGRRTMSGPVIYVCGEGAEEIKKRLDAWDMVKAAIGVSYKNGLPIYFVPSPVILPHQSEKEALIKVVENAVSKELQGVFPVAIFFDTYARCSDGDENSNRDASVFVAAADDLRERLGGPACFLIHHTPKSNEESMRGASALRGALNTAVCLVPQGKGTPEEQLILIKCDKQKDLASFPDEVVGRVQVQLGYCNFYGEPETSCIIEARGDAPAKKGKSLSLAQKTALETFLEAAKEKSILDSKGKFAGVDLKDWRKFFYTKSTADSSDAKRQAFKRVREDLIELEKLTVRDNIYFPTSQEDILIVTEYAKKLNSLSDRDSVTDRDITVTCHAANDAERDVRDTTLGGVTVSRSFVPAEEPQGEEITTQEEKKRIQREEFFKAYDRGELVNLLTGATVSEPLAHATVDVSPSRGPNAERAGVPSGAVREGLEPGEAVDRVSPGEDGNASLLAGDSFPGQGKPEEAEEELGATSENLVKSKSPSLAESSTLASTGVIEVGIDEEVTSPPLVIGWQSVAPDVATAWMKKQDELTQAEYRQRVAELESSVPELFDPRGRAARELYARTCGEEGFEDEKLPVV